MRCYCCDSEISLARKVKLRRLTDWDPSTTDVMAWTEADWNAYHVYKEQWTYRWAFICHVYYRLLDNDCGAAEIGARVFNIAGVSRHDKAAVINEAKYLAFQKREAQKLGLDL
jgi:hypothetical protein